MLSLRYGDNDGCAAVTMGKLCAVGTPCHITDVAVGVDHVKHMPCFYVINMDCIVATCRHQTTAIGMPSDTCDTVVMMRESNLDLTIVDIPDLNHPIMVTIGYSRSIPVPIYCANNAFAVEYFCHSFGININNMYKV